MGVAFTLQLLSRLDDAIEFASSEASAGLEKRVSLLFLFAKCWPHVGQMFCQMLDTLGQIGQAILPNFAQTVGQYLT